MLIALAVLLIVMLAGVLGGNVFKPADWHKSFKVGLGLDLSSGTSVTLKAQLPNKGVPSQGSMTKAIQIITNRVEATGFTGSTVTQQGKNEIVVSVPGAGAEKVATLVGETALLRLRQVILEASNTTVPTTPTPSASPSASPSTSATPSTSRARRRRTARRPSPSPSGGAGQAVGASQLGAGQPPKASPSPTSASAAPFRQQLAVGEQPRRPASQGRPRPPTPPGDASILTPQTVADFNKVNCADKNWKSQIYGTVPSNWNNPTGQTVTCLSGVKYALGPAVVQGKDLTGVQAQDQTTGWVVVFNVKSPARVTRRSAS